MSWLLASHLVDLVTAPEWQFVVTERGDQRSFVLHHDAVFALAWLLGLSRHLDPTAPPDDRLIEPLPRPAGRRDVRGLAVPGARRTPRRRRGRRAARPLLLPRLGLPGGRAAGAAAARR